MMMETEEYTPPVLAKFFHQFPHFNITFHLVNSTFCPENELYLESLGILASIPAAWLILTLLVLLIYLLTRCCDRNSRRKRSITPLKWTLAVFTVLCCGAVAVGLYGNDDVHNGIVQFIAAAKNIDDIITSVKNQTMVVEDTLEKKIEPLLYDLEEIFEQRIGNVTAYNMLLRGLDSMKGNTSAALASTKEISNPLRKVGVGGILSITQTAETIRWPVTMALLSLLLLFCIILLFGVARHSRCALITFSVFGLFAVIISWLLASLYLASSVALGDLCVAPDSYVELEVSAVLQRDILEYYIRCEDSQSNPFTQRLRESQRAVDAVESSLLIVTKIAEEFYDQSKLHPKLDVLTTSVNLTDRLVSGLAALLECRPLHRQYRQAVKSVCDIGLYGLTFMLVSSAAAGLFFTVLVWVDSHTWIYIRKRRDYLQVDEQDPFLPPSSTSRRSQGSYGSTGYFRPRHSHSHTPPPTPPFPGTLNGRAPREEKPHHASFGDGSSTMLGPNNGQYPTLSKQCKTLESSDFY